MNLKANWKFIIFPIVVVALIVGIFIYIFAVKGPKTPATAQLVQEVFESNELMYGDVTVDYREKWNVDDMLQKAVACEKDDLRFDFFAFDSVEVPLGRNTTRRKANKTGQVSFLRTLGQCAVLSFFSFRK